MLASRLVEFFRAAPPTYVVGGAVRDRLLGRPVHDYDLLVEDDALGLGRRLADALGGAYYPLDAGFPTARVLIGEDQIDVAQMRGASLDEDLGARDFTINAMAFNLADWLDPTPTIIDPTGGQADLATLTIRAVHEQSLRADPARLLRAPRLVAQLGGLLDPQTEGWIRRDAERLLTVSPERLREELWRSLLLPGAADILRHMDRLGLLSRLLPEVTAMQGVTQAAPHTLDVYDHSLMVLTQIEGILGGLGLGGAASLPEVAAALEPVREPLHQRLQGRFVIWRSRWSLLKLAALLHDVGKPATRSVDGAKIHFYRHEEVGAELALAIGQRLRLSTRETGWLTTVIRYHLRPLFLAQRDTPSRRSLYRYFRDTGETAPDILLLSIADNRSKGGASPTGVGQDRVLQVAADLLSLYYNPQDTTVVAPPAFLTGHDLMRELRLNPGPQIGELLEKVREATATGQVSTREQALDFARRATDQGRSRRSR